MELTVFPAWIHEREARKFYPALDDDTKNRISEEDFRNYNK